MSKFEYRLIKSSWGIAIDIEASYVCLKTPPTFGERISNNIWLTSNIKPLSLSESQFQWILKGLKLISEKITHKIDVKEHVLITISNIELNPSDYQIDGLALAIIGWTCQEFNISSPKLDIEFDKMNNKYSIDWDRAV
jgi:hypothetical protein